ncbi:hypothetical protein HOLleu_30431 [Holothuria leucospilota]|uniref:Uncharacterized protein n=1 Tax=Holothuria leucospilota TaxID=206669 RepID=A0A9Q1H0G7_HOLLE|nr:hypothetical protein HOLleu_30431 [Holothuria leucospilota]
MTTFPNIDDIRKRVVFSRPSYSRSNYKDMRNLHPKRRFTNSNDGVSSDTEIKTNDAQEGRDVTSKMPESHIFVQVELLQPRDVFGLSTLNVDLGIDHEQSSVSLVSKGAELIMIQKDCFVRHATAQVRRNLRNLVRAYPTTQTLQSNLQNHTNWMRYKAETMDDILSEKVSLHDVAHRAITSTEN